jgi:hypothetical protein
MWGKMFLLMKMKMSWKWNFLNYLILPIHPSSPRDLNIEKLLKNSAHKKLIRSPKNGVLHLYFRRNSCLPNDTM